VISRPRKHYVAWLGGVGIDPLLPNSCFGVPFHLDHVDLVIGGSERPEKGPVGKAQGDPRQCRMRPQQREKDEFALGLVRRLDGLLEEDRANRLLHRPGVVQGPANLVLNRPDDLTVELPNDVGDVPSSGVEPGQVDQDGSERYGQQHEAGQHRSQPELVCGASPWRRCDRRRGRLPRRSSPY
jgi:hypothetical protein